VPVTGSPLTVPVQVASRSSPSSGPVMIAKRTGGCSAQTATGPVRDRDAVRGRELAVILDLR
jgi:hypothetical protein